MGRTSSINCLHCNRRLADGRKSYHDECLELARVVAQTEDKECPSCLTVKRADQFANDANRLTGKFPYCLDCTRERNKGAQRSTASLNGYLCPLDDTPIRGHKNRRYCSEKCKDRVKTLKSNFGLTVAEYRALLTDADGVCPLCHKATTKWHVDHNHLTKEVTGVVCGSCNVTLLAASKHDVLRVRRLLAYLTETPAQRLGVHAKATKEVTSNLHTRWKQGRPLH